MQIGTFRKNVMKTVFAKPVKLGLRTVSKNTTRTNVAHGTVQLKVNNGRVVQALSQYVLGQQITQEMKDAAFTAMADMSYDLTMLCRVLKVKMPSATKKVKLTGTRTAALLQLDALTTDLLAVASTGLFDAPPMSTVKKMVTMPNKGGVKEERDVQVVDVALDTEAEKARQAKMQTLLSGVVDLFWRITFDTFGKTPVALIDDKFARLQKAFPAIEFDLAVAKTRAEVAAAKAAKPAKAPKAKAADKKPETATA